MTAERWEDERLRTGPGGTAARERAEAVVETTSGAAKEVASEAAAQARTVAGEAATQARMLADTTRQELREQADLRAGRAAAGMRTWSNRLGALARGNTEAAGPMARYAEEAQQRLSQLASRLDDGGIDGVLDELRSFARRRPVAFLGFAGAAGFLVGRMVRSAAAAGERGGNGDRPYVSSGELAPPLTGPLGGPSPLVTAPVDAPLLVEPEAAVGEELSRGRMR